MQNARIYAVLAHLFSPSGDKEGLMYKPMHACHCEERSDVAIS